MVLAHIVHLEVGVFCLQAFSEFFYPFAFQLLLGEYEEPKSKKMKGSVYMVPELTYLLSSCEERLAFVNLGLEVSTYRCLYYRKAEFL